MLNPINKSLKQIVLLIVLMFISNELFSQVLGNNNRLGIIKNDVFEDKPITFIDQYEKYILYSNVNEYDLYLYNKLDSINQKIEIDEINIYSAKIIRFLDMILIEVIGSSNMGNGNLYIFDVDLNILLKTYYVNTHFEDWDYVYFREIESFKNREYISGETFGEIFRNGTLNIEYHYEKRIIRIHGIHDYISEKDEKSEIIMSKFIEEVYMYSKSDNKFVLLKMDK